MAVVRISGNSKSLWAQETQTLGAFKKGWQLKRLRKALALDSDGPRF